MFVQEGLVFSSGTIYWMWNNLCCMAGGIWSGIWILVYGQVGPCNGVDAWVMLCAAVQAKPCIGIKSS